jgi:hypothetical protein
VHVDRLNARKERRPSLPQADSIATYRDADFEQITSSLTTMDQSAKMTDKDTLQRCTSESATLAAGEQTDLRQTFSIWSLGALILCLMATWEALGSVVSQALISGGAPCLFYN